MNEREVRSAGKGGDKLARGVNNYTCKWGGVGGERESKIESE